jgi:hypothetical protein
LPSFKDFDEPSSNFVRFLRESPSCFSVHFLWSWSGSKVLVHGPSDDPLYSESASSSSSSVNGPLKGSLILIFFVRLLHFFPKIDRVICIGAGFSDYCYNLGSSPFEFSFWSFLLCFFCILFSVILDCACNFKLKNELCSTS